METWLEGSAELADFYMVCQTKPGASNSPDELLHKEEAIRNCQWGKI